MRSSSTLGRWAHAATVVFFLACAMLVAAPRAYAQPQLTEREWKLIVGIPAAMPIPPGMPHPVFTDAVQPKTSGASTQGVIAPGGGNDGGFASNLVLSNPDGSGQHYTTSSNTFGAGYYTPRWKPDASGVIAVGRNDGVILVGDYHGTNLVSIGRGYSPSWSPDGQQIWFTDTVSGTAEIFHMMANGTGRTQMTVGGIGFYNPVVSPDGSQVAFTAADNRGYTDVHVMNVNGTGERAVTSGLYAATPTWLNATTVVAAISVFDVGVTDRFVTMLHRVTTDGFLNEVVSFTDGPYDFQPLVQEDGSILFASQSGGTRMTVKRVNPDGSNLTRIAFGEGADASPDGAYLLFTDYAYPSQNDWGCAQLSSNAGFDNVTVTGKGSKDQFTISLVVKLGGGFQAVGTSIDNTSNLALVGHAPEGDGTTVWAFPTAGTYTATYHVNNVDDFAVNPTIVVRKNGTTETIPYQCQRLTHFIHGKVADDQGRPLKGVQIDIHGRDYYAQAFTDDHGNYMSRWMVDGDYFVTATLAGHDFGAEQRRLIAFDSPQRDQVADFGHPLANLLNFGAREVDAPDGASQIQVTVVYTGFFSFEFDLKAFPERRSIPSQVTHGRFAQSGTQVFTVNLPRSVYDGHTVNVRLYNITDPDVVMGINSYEVIRLHAPPTSVNFTQGELKQLNSRLVTATVELSFPAPDPVTVQVTAHIVAPATAGVTAKATTQGGGYTGTATFRPGQTTAQVVIDVGDTTGQVVLSIDSVSDAHVTPGPTSTTTVGRYATILALPVVYNGIILK